MNTQTPTPSSRGSWITPVLVTVGIIALVGAIGTAAFAGIRMFVGGQAHSDSVSVAGVTAIDVRSSSAQFTVDYDDVTEATLDVQGVRGWNMEVRDSTLTVRPPRGFFGGWWFSGEQRVTLILPHALESGELDATFQLNSGSLAATGNFDKLKVEVNAGSAGITGEAQELTAVLNAGNINVGLEGVREASYEVNAGRVTASLLETTPDAIDIDVNAGSLTLVVPDDVYNVSSNVSAGKFDDSGLQTASASSHRIDVRLAAGNVTVRPEN